MSQSVQFNDFKLDWWTFIMFPKELNKNTNFENRANFGSKCFFSLSVPIDKKKSHMSGICRKVYNAQILSWIG